MSTWKRKRKKDFVDARVGRDDIDGASKIGKKMAGSTELLSPWPCEPTVNMCTAGILAVGSKSGTAVRSKNRLVYLFSLAMQKSRWRAAISSTRMMKSAGPTSQFFVSAPPKGLCASQSAAMQSQRLSLCRNPTYFGCRRQPFRTHGDIFCHQAPSKIVDQVMIARHGLSHREATPIDPPHPLSVHRSQSQLAGLRAKTLQ